MVGSLLYCLLIKNTVPFLFSNEQQTHQQILILRFVAYHKKNYVHLISVPTDGLEHT